MLPIVKKINKLAGGLLVLCALAGPCALAQQRSENFSLKDCINYALEHHPSSTIYKNKSEIAQEQIRESVSSLLPSVSAQAGIDYNLKLQTSIIPAGSLSQEEVKLQMGNKFSTGAYIQAEQKIFDRDAYLKVKASKVDKQVADLNVLKENETIIFNTASAYYKVIAYGEKNKLLLDSEQQYLSLLKVLKLQYEQGVVKKSEYDRTRVNLNNVQSEISLNVTNYLLSLNKLKNSMGLDLNAQLAVDQEIDSYEQSYTPSFGDFDVSKLADYQIDLKNTEKADINLQQSRAGYLPTLSAYGKYGANSYGNEFSKTFNDIFDYSAVGLKLSVPIFSGFKNDSKVRQSSLDAENQRKTLALNSSDYKLSFQNSSTSLYSSYTSLKKNKENMSLAKDVLDAAAVEYREGTSDLSSYLDADYSWKEARTNYITALVDFLGSKIAMEKAQGTLNTYVNNLK